jgi:hypothetical protein
MWCIYKSTELCKLFTFVKGFKSLNAIYQDNNGSKTDERYGRLLSWKHKILFSKSLTYLSRELDHGYRSEYSVYKKDQVFQIDIDSIQSLSKPQISWILTSCL